MVLYEFASRGVPNTSEYMMTADTAANLVRLHLVRSGND